MKVLGWCTQCRKIKQVRLSRIATGPIAVGVCDACEEDEK